MAERAEKKILELETVIRRLQNTPVAFVYVDLWKLIQVLYTQNSLSRPD